MDTTKISDSFDYHAEQAKVNFQSNVGSLLEMQSLISAKISAAQEQKKTGAFFTIAELEVLKDWLLQSSASLMADYTSLDRTNRLTNKLYRAAMAINHANRRTPNLKDLVA